MNFVMEDFRPCILCGQRHGNLTEPCPDYSFGMTAFTDEDLKRLKESENALQRSLGIPALLARLEAAEHYIQAMENVEDTQLIRRKAWRKAAGKDR